MDYLTLMGEIQEELLVDILVYVLDDIKFDKYKELIAGVPGINKALSKWSSWLRVYHTILDKDIDVQRAVMINTSKRDPVYYFYIYNKVKYCYVIINADINGEYLDPESIVDVLKLTDSERYISTHFTFNSLTNVDLLSHINEDTLFQIYNNSYKFTAFTVDKGKIILYYDLYDRSPEHKILIRSNSNRKVKVEYYTTRKNLLELWLHLLYGGQT